MAKVSMSTKVDVSPEQLWEMIGGFNKLADWHPAIETSKLENDGQVRRLSLVGGGQIVERLERVDDDERLYTYSIESSPLPVANYTATIRVTEGEDGKAMVEWSSDFAPSGLGENEAVKAIQGVYQAGFDNLRKMFGG